MFRLSISSEGDWFIRFMLANILAAANSVLESGSSEIIKERTELGCRPESKQVYITIILSPETRKIITTNYYKLEQL